MSEPTIRDVVLFEGRGDRGDAMYSGTPPIVSGVTLAPGLYIERQDGELNRLIKDACAPRGHHWDLVTDTLPTFYSFVRETTDTERWDEGRELTSAVVLSRFCHPTSIGLEYAARVYSPGVRHQKDYAIEPAMVVGHGNQAFIPNAQGRNWLTPADVTDLPALITSLPKAPERVRRAVWFHEYAARTEHVPVRLTLAATGVEALVHTERGKSTRQFVVGATGLAADCGLTFTEAQATDAYDQRSRYAHGMTVQAASPPVLISLEEVLRAAVRKALLDPAYANIFASDAVIRARFPL